MWRLGASRGQTFRTIGALSAVGISFVLAVMMGAGIGYLLDRWLGSSPWAFILFFFIGVTAGILNVIRASAAYLRDEER
ncbi:MAG: AtpZ/AtpI family protein [Vicinamibacterales bacterium]|jgi:ATP synthase protein I|nr:F0F1 ATP synthase assembly protein I [Acidobacteriota bacterium]MDP6372408.1 AtpZ/AtpI family protein [Vicinamibacterales bacterium]MDP6608969.1 AtpZ/AtpI family protein [Vicinamibacterales bacterium]HAK54321.1 F0F1 ATP synthase assembly protein I [Acidobacteriota bacterium]|tara:strand:- start:24453 stop:24689 length:237 start_codon:yes stop_codon:yes gene_type:complete